MKPSACDRYRYHTCGFSIMSTSTLLTRNKRWLQISAGEPDQSTNLQNDSAVYLLRQSLRSCLVCSRCSLLFQFSDISSSLQDRQAIHENVYGRANSHPLLKIGDKYVYDFHFWAIHIQVQKNTNLQDDVEFLTIKPRPPNHYLLQHSYHPEILSYSRSYRMPP